MRRGCHVHTLAGSSEAMQPQRPVCAIAGGGLLAAVPADRAAACVQQLRALGYRQATVVGRIEDKALLDKASSSGPIPLISMSVTTI